MGRLSCVLLVAMVPLAPALTAQAPMPQFEAASIKRNTLDDFAPGMPRFSGETFTARQMPVAMLISTAYGIPTRELVDGPGWISSDTTDRFDAIAKAAPGSSRADMQAMLRHMLEDRFKLRLRLEKRDMPVYLLTKMDAGGTLGPNLRRPTADCSPKCTGRVGAGGASGVGMDWRSCCKALPTRFPIGASSIKPG